MRTSQRSPLAWLLSRSSCPKRSHGLTAFRPSRRAVQKPPPGSRPPSTSSAPASPSSRCGRMRPPNFSMGSSRTWFRSVANSTITAARCSSSCVRAARRSPPRPPPASCSSHHRRPSRSSLRRPRRRPRLPTPTAGRRRRHRRASSTQRWPRARQQHRWPAQTPLPMLVPLRSRPKAFRRHQWKWRQRRRRKASSSRLNQPSCASARRR
mmetsp:Transcript_70140/g.139075  ORF Transcript_70140/g.139075 Transcript_70140/m.139075 type:complete len:209 (+) Transcript_70140:366-992(+)